MNIYQEGQAEEVRKKMHAFLQNSIEITRPIILEAIKSGHVAGVAVSDDNAQKLALGFDAAGSGDIFQVNRTHQAYCGFQNFLNEIDVSENFVAELTAKVGGVFHAFPNIDPADAREIQEKSPIDVRVVDDVNSPEEKLDAQRTAWLQYSSLLSLFAMVDRGIASKTQKENPIALVMETNIDPIQSFINQQVKALGPS